MVFSTSCELPNRKHQKEKVHVYQIDDDTWMYVIDESENSGGGKNYLYATSNQNTNSFKNLSWQSSQSKPQQIENKEELEEQEIEEQDLTEDAQSEISNDEGSVSSDSSSDDGGGDD